MKLSDSAFLREHDDDGNRRNVSPAAFQGHKLTVDEVARLRGIATKGGAAARTARQARQAQPAQPKDEGTTLRDVHYNDECALEYVSYVDPDHLIRRFGWLAGVEGDIERDERTGAMLDNRIARIEISDGAYAFIPMVEVERRAGRDGDSQGGAIEESQDNLDLTTPATTRRESQRTVLKEALGVGRHRLRADLTETRSAIPLGPESSGDFSVTLRYDRLAGFPSEDDVMNYVAHRYPESRVLDADDRTEGLLGLVLHHDAAMQGGGDYHDFYRVPGIANEEMGGAADHGSHLPSGTGGGYGYVDDSNSDAMHGLEATAELQSAAGGDVLEILDPKDGDLIDGSSVKGEDKSGHDKGAQLQDAGMTVTGPNTAAPKSGESVRQGNIAIGRVTKILNAAKAPYFEVEAQSAGQIAPQRMWVVRDGQGRLQQAHGHPGNSTERAAPPRISQGAVNANIGNIANIGKIAGPLYKDRPISEVAQTLLHNIDSKATNVPQMVDQMIAEFAKSGGFSQILRSGTSIDPDSLLEGAIRATAQSNPTLWSKVSNFVARNGIDTTKPAMGTGGSAPMSDTPVGVDNDNSPAIGVSPSSPSTGPASSTPGMPMAGPGQPDALSPEQTDALHPEHQEGVVPGSTKPPEGLGDLSMAPDSSQWTDQDKFRFQHLDDLPNPTAQDEAEKSQLMEKFKRASNKVAAANSSHSTAFGRLAKVNHRIAQAAVEPPPGPNLRYPESRPAPHYEMAPRQNMKTIFSKMRIDKIASEGDYLCARVVWDPDLFEGVGGAGVRQTVVSFIKGWASQIDRHKNQGWIGKPHFSSFDQAAGRATMRFAASDAANWPRYMIETDDETGGYGGNY